MVVRLDFWGNAKYDPLPKTLAYIFELNYYRNVNLRVTPLTLRQANDLIEKLHRHHKPVQGHRFSIGAIDVNCDDKLVGALVVGRPVARACDPYLVAEVTRLVTDGTINTCSLLYSASARAAKAMGFQRIQTYILATESGTSLKASGWNCCPVTRKDGVGWNNRSGRRSDQPVVQKIRWQKVFRP